MQPLFGRKNPCKCDRKYGFKELYIYAIMFFTKRIIIYIKLHKRKDDSP